MVLLLWKIIWPLLTRLPMQLAYNPAIDFGQSQRNENFIHTGTLMDVLIIAKNWKQPTCPSTGEWLDKLWYVRTIEHDPAIKCIPWEDVDESLGNYIG